MPNQINNDLNMLKLNNLSNENINVELRECLSKEGKIYYAFYINDNRVEFLSIPPSVYGYVKLLKNVNKNVK